MNIKQQNKELVINHIGDHWLEFSETIPPTHVNEHEEGLALIFTIFPDSLLNVQFIELNIDEHLDAHMKSVALRHLIYENMKDIINKMGVSLNNDNLELTHLPLMREIVSFFMTVTFIDDSFNTVLPQLEAKDVHPKYRFINAISKVIYDEEEPDISDLEHIVDDCSEMSLKSLIDSITQTDGHDIPPDNIIARVTNAVEALDGTLGYRHIRNGGALGSPVSSYLNFFNGELTALLRTNTLEDYVTYGRDVISLHLISEINDDRIKEVLLVFFDGRIDDLQALIRIESVIKSLKLPSANKA